MTAIPHAALALTSALGRFERARSRQLEAANSVGDAEGDLSEASEAKTLVRASIGVLHVSDGMWTALLELQCNDN
jgi:hypothetical protein